MGFGRTGGLTSPTPCTSIACCENWRVVESRSRDISIGYSNVMALSVAMLLTNPWLTHSCQTTVLSQCCVILKSTACVSMLSKYVGRASESWLCS